jgi:hypothetical protein
MSAVPKSDGRGLAERLSVPNSLREQLQQFRSRVWSTKMLESLAFAVAGVLVAFLVVFTVDRFIDTPQTIRFGIFAATLACWLAIPWAFHRWVWRHRRLDQLAKLLRVREPNIGDQLLSVIELAESDQEQARSRTLCAAAIAQVADAAKKRNLNDAAPLSRVKTWSYVVVGSAVTALALAAFSPAATGNAWARLMTPWRNTPRYTFTTIQPVASHIVVPHGEAMTLPVKLDEKSRWQPNAGALSLAGLPDIKVDLTDDGYQFTIPPQTQTVTAQLKIGDFSQSIEIEPKMRPELIEAMAQVKLPEYLQLTEPVDRDVRGGTLAVVDGSTATVQAVASRELDSATINDQTVAVEAAKFSSAQVAVAEKSDKLKLQWRDKDGLAGREPFDLAVTPVVDEAPSIASQELPRQAVVLDSEQLNFSALAADDFGVKNIGISWRGLDDKLLEKPAKGEKLLRAGGPDQSSIQSPATFSAKQLGIDPQPIEVRLWVEDYLPGRPRVYSPPHILFVLTPEEHAVWITDQLSKWHRASLDVRDREMQLHETNKKLREMTPEQLADDEMREQLRTQAGAEANNGRRLAGLSKAGEQLLRQAARNPEIGVGHLDRWAEMLQILNDISSNRMPGVSDLLGKAAAETKLARAGQGGKAKPSGPSAGQNKNSAGGSGKPADESKMVASDKPKMPSISDMESSLQPPDDKAAEGEATKKKYDGSRLTLPKTTLAGPAKPKPKQDEEEDKPEDSTVDQAVYEQADLLAEFEKIADELNTLLANMEGSTLVKRLKSASREQNQVAERIGSRIDALFGQTAKVEKADTQLLKDLADIEQKSSQSVSYIMDDMQSYFERRRMNQFKVVLEDMRKSEVTDAMKLISEELPKEHGMSIAQAEYWSDTLDRWAEDLVDPACSGSCPGCKTSDALPPSLILEVLQILEGEVNLREATRVAEQAKAGLVAEKHSEEANKLSETQHGLRDRTKAVVTKIQELPDGDKRFPKEIALLSQVSDVMFDAEKTLALPQTGAPAIAAETEAIELLLQCKRINPNGGGGGGTSPGGGGSGTTQDSALALLGTGLNQNEKREHRDVSQATGEVGRVMPEEFRAGLDEYFNRLENGL